MVFAGIIQGAFLGIFILTSKKHKSKASFYLGWLILFFTLSNLQHTADDIEWINWNSFNLIYLPYLLFAPPFLYFFVAHYLDPQHVNKKTELLLYLPATVFLSITFIYKLVALLTQNTYQESAFLEDLGDFIDRYADFANIFLFFIVLIILFRKLTSFTKKPFVFDKGIIPRELLWLKVLLSIFLIILIPWLIYTFNYFYDESIFYLPLLVLASLVIYVLGYIGIHKIGILNERKKIKSIEKDRSNLYTIVKEKNEHIARIEKIIIQDQGYLNPNLTLDTLTEELQISKSHLSRIINTELKMSFSDYLNSLRIKEAKQLLLNPEFSNYTIVAIGLESGFNSKTTFNTIFKKFTSQTPSQFRKNHSN